MKKLLLLLLIFLLSGCSKVDLGATSDISATALASKYNSATEIKAKYAIDGVALKATPKADPKDTIRVTVGNETTGLGAVGEFEPSVKISRWDEVSMKLTPKGLDKIASKDKKVSFEGDKIKFETPKVDYKMYDLPVSKDLPEGGYEFEWILKEKSATNVVEFNIETEELGFYYQPIYTEEEISKLAEQNDFINREAMGSYAVYASENKVNYVGGKEYKNGKIGQIHRPKIIDSIGNWVWGELKVDTENGILSVTIPNDFLDNAIYPVRHAAGLTFGYTTQPTAGTVGLSTFGPYFYKAQTGVAGTITQIDAWIYLPNDDGGTTRYGGVAIYDSSKNYLDSASQIALASDRDPHKVTFSLSEAVAASTNYYLVAAGGPHDDTYFTTISYDTTTGQDTGYDTTAWTSLWPNPAVFNGTNTLRNYGIYATYTASAGATYCGHTGGDWYVNSTCWISANTTTPGNVYIGTGGSLNCNNGAIISARSRSVGNGGSYSIGNSGGNCGWSLWTPN